jgi:phosphatidylglycerol:prolipoprotein diacylglycerol transferase
MIYSLVFPAFDPVLIAVGPFMVRWYALAYIVSLVAGWRIVRHLVRRGPPVATAEQVDDFLTWATLGVVLGGRLGYVLFYQPSHYFTHPLDAIAVWQGGMSFHGGMLGVTVAMVLFCYRQGINLLGFSDRVATIVPLGLGLGRCANFINGELWGREAPPDLPWAMGFPNAPGGILLLRHPSQIYEALMEGLILLAIMLFLFSKPRIRARFGLLTGAFLAGYAIARIIGEHFREPDAFLGFLPGGLTMGQVLSVPMLLAGIVLIGRAMRKPAIIVA